MIADFETNFLYLADTLKLKHPAFSNDFENLLKFEDVRFDFLPGTKDIWARDYMPIQIESNEYVKFKYYPDYLIDSVKWQKTISDAEQICKTININFEVSNLVIDGGNVIKGKDIVIMCDKVFLENPRVERKKLIKKLEQLFKVSRIIFIPTHSEDKIGHADGIVRFYRDNTVLINDFKNEPAVKINYLNALKKAGLEYLEVPYNPYQNRKMIDAKGIYINYLELENHIILPVFNINEDEKVILLFEQLFPKSKISTIQSNEIAENGGVLNCISWNILKNKSD